MNSEQRTTKGSKEERYMKIHKIQNQLLGINQYKSKENRPKDLDVKNKDSVNIEISNSAKELSQKINESEDKNFSEKVERIKESILGGKYKVSCEDIAKKILQAINEQKGSDKK